MTPKQAFIFIAQGTEEAEFTITYDVLVRAGINVQSVFVGDSSTADKPAYVKCSRGLRIVPDLALQDLSGGAALKQADCFIVPGGKDGAATIAANQDVQALLSAAYGKGITLAFICNGSLAVKAAGIAHDRQITSHPGVKDQLTTDYRYSEERVVKADHLITSRGPGTSFEFALAIVEALVGEEVVADISAPMMLP